MRERELSRVIEDTTSVWSLLHDRNPEFVNYLFTDENKVSSAGVPCGMLALLI